MALVRRTVCYYCLRGCSALVECAQRSRLAWGVGADAGSCVSAGAPPCPRAPRGACCGLSRSGVPSLCLPVGHSTRSVRFAGSVRLLFGFAPRVRCVCVRSCSRGVRPPRPLCVGVARALRLVLVQGAGRAVSGGSCPSAFPAAVPCSAYLARRGLARFLRPLALLGVTRPPAGRPAFVCLLCALWGQHEGAGGGASRLGLGRPESGALQHPTVRPYGRAAGARYPLAVDVGSAGVGTRHQPHCTRSCGLAFRALGPARERPRVGASCLGVGRPGSGALPPPPVGWFGRGRPSPIQQRPLLRARFSRFGGGTRASGWGASCLGTERPGSGPLPCPTVCPLGTAAGADYRLAVGAGDAGVGTRHQPHSGRSCELAFRAVGAARGRPGGAPLAWVWGVRGRALSHPRSHGLWGRAAGAYYPLAVGAGDAGVGTGHGPHSVRSCELALRAVGAARARLGGTPLAWA